MLGTEDKGLKLSLTGVEKHLCHLGLLPVLSSLASREDGMLAVPLELKQLVEHLSLARSVLSSIILNKKRVSNQ